MSDTITVPGGVGPVKSEYVYAGGAAAAGVVAYWVWSRRSAAATAPTVATGAVDPSATTGDYAAGIDAYANPAHVTSGSVTTQDPSTMPPTTNADWADRAQSKLSDVGWDSQAVAAAIGRYLNRQPLLSSAEVEIIQTATAMVGHPPAGDFSIIMPTAPAAVTPAPAPSAATLTAPAGLKASSVTRTGVHLSYHSVGGASGYLLTRSDGATITTPAISVNVAGLKPGTAYRYTVAAIGAGGAGPVSAPVSFTTKK